MLANLISRLFFVGCSGVSSSFSIDGLLDEAISLTAATDIYDPRHPVSSRKHIIFMEGGINMTVIQGFMGPSCSGHLCQQVVKRTTV